MMNKKYLTKHICNEELVSAFIDNRMNEKEKKEYIKKIEDCPTVRDCSHCKKLINEFLSIKRNCFTLQSEYLMPKNLERNLLSKVHNSFQPRKNKI
jgi:hypothetical protein